MRLGFRFTTVVVILGYVFLHAAPVRLTVKIINRQYSDKSYSYEVPGHAESTSDDTINCRSDDDTTRCSGNGNTSTLYTAPRIISYTLTGATLSLLLPDGRVAVVNCDSKFKYTYGGAFNSRRGCRIPLVDDVDVEFSGSKAKLFWAESINGKKMGSETYNITAILH
jgi:hypothetical protein